MKDALTIFIGIVATIQTGKWMATLLWYAAVKPIILWKCPQILKEPEWWPWVSKRTANLSMDMVAVTISRQSAACCWSVSRILEATEDKRSAWMVMQQMAVSFEETANDIEKAIVK